MGMTSLRIVGPGLFFLLVFLSGFWLSHAGKPLNGIILTFHKLVSLAVVVFLAVTMYQTNQVAALSTLELTAGIVTGLFFLGAIITGGLLSIDKPMPAAILALHRLTPFLAVLSTAVTLFLLITRFPTT